MNGMHMRRVLLPKNLMACVPALVLAACAVAPAPDPQGIDAAAANLPANPDTPAPVWQDDPAGSLHVLSGLLCRPNLHSFAFTRRDSYPGRPEGEDVSCTYQAAEGGVITLHLTDFGRAVPVDAHLKGTARRIQETYRRSQMVTPPPVDWPDTVSAAFRIDAISTLRPGVAMETAVWIKRAGRWHIKARATYEADRRGQVAAAVLALMSRAEGDIAGPDTGAS